MSYPAVLRQHHLMIKSPLSSPKSKKQKAKVLRATQPSSMRQLPRKGNWRTTALSQFWRANGTRILSALWLLQIQIHSIRGIDQMRLLNFKSQNCVCRLSPQTKQRSLGTTQLKSATLGSTATAPLTFGQIQRIASIGWLTSPSTKTRRLRNT